LPLPPARTVANPDKTSIAVAHSVSPDDHRIGYGQDVSDLEAPSGCGQPKWEIVADDIAPRERKLGQVI